MEFTMVKSKKVERRERKETKQCPVSGCPSRNTDMKKHLAHCHKMLTAQEIADLVRALPRKPRASKKTVASAGDATPVAAGEPSASASIASEPVPSSSELQTLTSQLLST